MIDVWKMIDDIKCINLYEREDRYKKCQATFNDLRIPVRFFRTGKHPNSGAQGCFESHISCITEAYNNGCETLLIFEDDVQYKPYQNNAICSTITKFLSSSTQWDILYIGHYPDVLKGWHENVDTHIMKGPCTATHAYIIHRRFMSTMVQSTFEGTPIDLIYKKKASAYYVYPSIFQQDYGLGSDIEGSAQYMKYTHELSRGCELYAYYIGIPIWYMLIFIVLLLGLIILSRKLNKR